MSPVGTMLRRTKPAGGFDPSLISWYAAYWASDPLWSNPGDGNKVSSWRDLSGSGLDVTQGGADSSKPTYRASYASLNNQPAVEFTTGSDYLSVTLGTPKAQPLTVVGIVRQSDTTGNRYFMQNQFGLFALGSRRSTTPAIYAGGFVNSSVSSDTNAHLMYGYFNGASSYIVVDSTKSTGNPGTNDISGSLRLSNSTNGMVGGVAFVGVYVGDIEANANWAAFKAGITATYGVTT